MPAMTGIFRGIGLLGVSPRATAATDFARKGAENLIEGMFLTSFAGVRQPSPKAKILLLAAVFPSAAVWTEASWKFLFTKICPLLATELEKLLFRKSAL